MKRCPQCNRVESDSSLAFCRVDGAALIDDSGSFADDLNTAKLGSAEAASEIETSALPHRTDASHAAPTTVLPPGQTNTRDLAKPKRRKATIAIVVIVTAIVAAVIAVVVNFLSHKNSASIQSIAVMPFVNGTGNADIEYLSDGMTETLISSLSQLPNLNVKPRSSVFRYKGKETSPQAIAKELSVQAILTGRVVQRGEELSLFVELIDVALDKVVWSQQYNRKQTELVTLQTEVARDVSGRLKSKLSGEDEAKVTKTYTTNPDAYQLYLRGRYYWNKRTAENIKKAMEQFQHAADTDPNYALAYAGLADCYVVLGDYTGAPEAATVPKAQAFARRALELDGSLVEAHTALAYSHTLLWQWEDAEREFKRAIGLNPNYATAHHWYNLLLMESGRFSEGSIEIKRAQELDPLSPIISYNVALNYLTLGDVNSSIEQSKRIIELEPNFPRAHQALALAYLKQRRYDEAIAEFQKAVSLSPNDRQALRDLGYGYAIAQKRDAALGVLKEVEKKFEKGEAYAADIAAVYAALGDKDQAFAWLENAFETRTGRLARIAYHTQFQSLRDDPRYADLRRRMGLK